MNSFSNPDHRTLAPSHPRTIAIVAVVILLASTASAQIPSDPDEPVPGQPGKDVVWVPTPDDVVEQMLDVAQIKPNDYVMDLGSGDGRNIIAAAKRGAWGMGIEYNPKLIEVSKRNAAAAGVYDQAQFAQGDMFEADISEANVLLLFLLPDNLKRLTPKFLDMRPGSRIVSNTFGIEGWTPDQSVGVPNCTTWCQVMLYIVPAKVAGTWETSKGPLVITQEFQKITGTLAGMPISGKLVGDQIAFTAGSTNYTGTIMRDRIEGEGWTAARQ